MFATKSINTEPTTKSDHFCQQTDIKHTIKNYIRSHWRENNKSYPSSYCQYQLLFKMPIKRAAQRKLGEERRNRATAENPPNSQRDSSTSPSAGWSFFSLWGNSLYQLIENVTVLQNQQNTHECTTASQYSALMARLDNLSASICHLSAEKEALRTENARIVDDYNRLLQTYNGTVSENQYLKNQLEVSRANEARTRANLDELVVTFTEATNKLNEMVLNSAQRQWLKGACRSLSHWSRARVLGYGFSILF